MRDTEHAIDGQLESSPGAAAPGEPAAAGAPAQAPDERPPAPATDSEGKDAGDEAAQEVQGDLDELVRTAAQRDEYLALAQRTQADFDNYRKRVARESASAHERGMTALVKELLPALDNLDRALAEAGGAGDGGGRSDGALLEGVRLVRAELAAALARAGIESFSPHGEPFDPSLHEAVATVPQPDERCASGTVAEVYQPGYRLGSSVIRPARVVVSA